MERYTQQYNDYKQAGYLRIRRYFAFVVVVYLQSLLDQVKGQHGDLASDASCSSAEEPGNRVVGVLCSREVGMVGGEGEEEEEEEEEEGAVAVCCTATISREQFFVLSRKHCT